jgi:hypothetical protein
VTASSSDATSMTMLRLRSFFIDIYSPTLAASAGSLIRIRESLKHCRMLCIATLPKALSHELYYLFLV